MSFNRCFVSFSATAGGDQHEKVTADDAVLMGMGKSPIADAVLMSMGKSPIADAVLMSMGKSPIADAVHIKMRECYSVELSCVRAHRCIS